MTDFWIALPFLVSLVFLGMPHGAIDHILYFSNRDQSLTTRRLLGFISVYLGLAVVMAMVWLLFPVLSCFALLLLTWAHWGEEEWFYESWKSGEVGILYGLVRGSYPMLLPLVAAPGHYLEVLQGALSLSGDIVPESINALLLSPYFAGLILCLVVSGSLIERWSSRRSPRWRIQTTETIFLYCLFIFLPPLFSIGLYFMFWHSLRHIQLMGKHIGEPLMISGNIRWSIFYKWALPFSLAGIFFVFGWALWNRGFLVNLPEFIGSYLVILWALTWPHALLTHRIFYPPHLRIR